MDHTEVKSTVSNQQLGVDDLKRITGLIAVEVKKYVNA